VIIDFAFSAWQSWERRTQLQNLHYPGIYAIATDIDLSGMEFDWIPQIVYFGMTNSAAGLRGRMKQFDNSLIGRPGHGGGQRFMFGQRTDGSQRQKLYVSVWTFECDVRSDAPADLRMMGEVLRAEFLCFAKYVEKFGRLPKFNDKKSSPKMRLSSQTVAAGSSPPTL